MEGIADVTTSEPAEFYLAHERMSQTDFRRFASLIQKVAGIHLTPCKKFLLESRFRRRLKALGFRTFRDYADYVFTPEGQADELGQLINAIATNKTDFFREPEHFRFLVDKILTPAWARGELYEKFVVWSAACSTGEEPFTLAMVLEEFARTHPGFTYSVLATDVSTKVLAKANNAVYEHDRIAPIPPDMTRRYLMRSRDRNLRLYRVVPELRSKVRFSHLNLMSPAPSFTDRAHAIFCRNVLIYFDRPTQEQVLNFLCRRLHPGGHLFVGHSETLTGLELPVVPVATTTYKTRRL